MTSQGGLTLSNKSEEPGTLGWLSGWVSAFGSGPDPRFTGSSATLGSLHSACFSSLCLCLCLSFCVSHEWINKILKKKNLKNLLFNKASPIGLRETRVTCGILHGQEHS